MPKIARVRLPDGRVARFRVPDDATPDQIIAAVKTKMAPQKEERGVLRRVDDFVRGAADAATLGYSDEIAAWVGDKTGLGGKRGDYEGNLAAQRKRDAEGGGERLAGQIAGAVALPTSKLAAAKGLRGVAGTAAEGAAYGAAYETGSADGGLSERLRSAPKGAAMGAGGGVAGRAVASAGARVLRGQQVSPEVRKLADEGVVMTPGRRGGKVRRTFEEGVLGSLPFVKSIPQAANRRSVEQFNVAAYNRALKPLGQKLPTKTPPGKEAIASVGDTIYGAYDQATAALSLGADVPLVVAAKRISANAPKAVGNDAPQLQGIVENTIAKLKQGRLAGEGVRDVLQDLRGEASDFATSSVANERRLGRELWKLHDELESALTRQNRGNVLEPFKRAREAVSMFKRVEAAAAKSPDGVFSPQQFRTAVTKRGFGTTTGKVARGDAPMQDLADAAKQVLPTHTPNSGTAERAFAGTASLGGPGALSLIDPTMGVLTGVPLVGYTPGIDKFLQDLALNRPDLFVRGGNALDNASPYLGTIGTMTALQQGQ